MLPWCPRCGTALSSHELAQGYEDVKDLTITAKFELVDEPGTYLLAWTTTPWTLLSNLGLAIDPRQTYTVVNHEGEMVILAEPLRASVLPGATELGDLPGDLLLGARYAPPFENVEEGSTHTIVAGDLDPDAATARAVGENPVGAAGVVGGLEGRRDYRAD